MLNIIFIQTIVLNRFSHPYTYNSIRRLSCTCDGRMLGLTVEQKQSLKVLYKFARKVEHYLFHCGIEKQNQINKLNWAKAEFEVYVKSSSVLLLGRLENGQSIFPKLVVLINVTYKLGLSCAKLRSS
jgi:hypothetical protein